MQWSTHRHGWSVDTIHTQPEETVVEAPNKKNRRVSKRDINNIMEVISSH